MKVINLYGGPGTGKSTTAAGLFHLMKNNDYKVELVTEFAKEVTYENGDLTNQLTILAEQEKRLHRLRGQVDYVITDSPLLLSTVYAHGTYASVEFLSMVWAIYNKYQNYDILLRRVKDYAEYGRKQTEEEAKEIDRLLREVLALSWDLEVPADQAAHQRIYQWVMKNRTLEV